MGNPSTKLTKNGDLITYVYDINRLVSVDLPGGITETFGYDDLGRRTSMANSEVSVSWDYDARNQLISAVNHTVGQSLDYDYDSNGLLTQMTGPDGSVHYLYDSKNRLIEQSDPIAGVYRFSYDQLDRRSSLIYPNGLVTEYEYDAAGRLLSILTSDSQGAVVDGYSYSYDEVGRRAQMALLHDPTVHDYDYDTTHRLVRWDRGPNRFEEYGYDDVGNRMSLTDDLGTITYSHDTANRLLTELRTYSGGGTSSTSYLWDNNGNLVDRTAGSAQTTYQWSSLDRLVEVNAPSGISSYGYDPDGLRVRETSTLR